METIPPILRGLVLTPSGVKHLELAHPGPAHQSHQRIPEGLLNLPATCHVLLLHQVGEPVDTSTLKMKIHLSQHIRNEMQE